MKKYSKRNKKTSLTGFKISYLFFVAGFVIAAFTVFTTVQTVTSSAKLVYLENEEYQLLKKNKELNSDLIESSSLTSLSENAEGLGFVQPAEVFYGQQKSEVAKLP